MSNIGWAQETGPIHRTESKKLTLSSSGTKLSAISVVPPVLNRTHLACTSTSQVPYLSNPLITRIHEPRFLSVRLVTETTRGCLPLPGEAVSTASSRVNFSDCSRARACSRWPFLSACAFPVRLLSLSLLFSTHYVRVECIKLWAKSLAFVIPTQGFPILKKSSPHGGQTPLQV
jgi:hypothetical protein